MTSAPSRIQTWRKSAKTNNSRSAWLPKTDSRPTFSPQAEDPFCSSIPKFTGSLPGQPSDDHPLSEHRTRSVRAGATVLDSRSAAYRYRVILPWLFRRPRSGLDELRHARFFRGL